MKAFALFVAATAATASAFAPSPKAPMTTQLSESLFKRVSDMDLWAPIKDSNDYGARGRKNLGTAKLADRSYVPSGLTKAQYERVRADDSSKKNANYQRNVAKAGKFLGFTTFYTQRGTNESGSWMKAPNRGHRMAKTKFDWSGDKPDSPEYTGIRM